MTTSRELDASGFAATPAVPPRSTSEEDPNVSPDANTDAAPDVNVIAASVPAVAAASPPRSRVTSRALAALTVFVALHAMMVARALLVPIALAALLALVLAPAVRSLHGMRVPRLFAAAGVLALVLTLALATASTLLGPARAWIERVPVATARAEQALEVLRRPLAAASKASQSLIDLTADAPPGKSLPVVAVQGSPGLAGLMLRETPALLTSAIAALFLVFLLLVHGDILLRKLVAIAPARLSAKKELVCLVREAQRELSRYLGTISLINLGLGAATACGLALLGLPDPWLWGGVVAVLNFAPYVGPALAALLLTFAGFAQFAQPSMALMAPTIFLGLHLLEGQLVTPMLIGRRLALDPVMIFLGLMLLGWLWGIAGLLLAVPLLACAKIVAVRLAPESAAARWLSR